MTERSVVTVIIALAALGPGRGQTYLTTGIS